MDPSVYEAGHEYIAADCADFSGPPDLGGGKATTRSETQRSIGFRRGDIAGRSKSRVTACSSGRTAEGRSTGDRAGAGCRRAQTARTETDSRIDPARVSAPGPSARGRVVLSETDRSVDRGRRRTDLR